MYVLGPPCAKPETHTWASGARQRVDWQQRGLFKALASARQHARQSHCNSLRAKEQLQGNSQGNTATLLRQHRDSVEACKCAFPVV